MFYFKKIGNSVDNFLTINFIYKYKNRIMKYLKKYEQYSSVKFVVIQENVEYDNLIKKIQSVLTKDLLKGMWNKDFDNPLAGHCYAATEALYWMIGGPESDWKTYVLSHLSWPEGLDKGETHWFLRNNKGEILDPTAGQFGGQDIAYDKGKYNSMMNHPKGGSKRAREIMRRISNQTK